MPTACWECLAVDLKLLDAGGEQGCTGDGRRETGKRMVPGTRATAAAAAAPQGMRWPVLPTHLWQTPDFRSGRQPQASPAGPWWWDSPGARSTMVRCPQLQVGLSTGSTILFPADLYVRLPLQALGETKSFPIETICHRTPATSLEPGHSPRSHPLTAVEGWARPLTGLGEAGRGGPLPPRVPLPTAAAGTVGC